MYVLSNHATPEQMSAVLSAAVDVTTVIIFYVLDFFQIGTGDRYNILQITIQWQNEAHRHSFFRGLTTFYSFYPENRSRKNVASQRLQVP